MRLTAILLLAATLLNHVVNTEASYLRAYKREPFLIIFAPMCAVTTIGSLLVARSYGVTGMLTILLAAVAVERFLETVSRLRPHLARVSQVSGALLVVVGLLMMFDYFTIIATYLQALTPQSLKNRL